MKAGGIVKNKKRLFSSYIESPNKIKLQMLQVGLKCKQLEEKIQSIQRVLKVNNHNGNNWYACSLRFLLGLVFYTVIIRFCLSVAAKSPSV